MCPPCKSLAAQAGSGKWPAANWSSLEKTQLLYKMWCSSIWGIAADLRFNFWEVNKTMKNSLGSFDFLEDFSTTKKNWGVEGTLWVEMKMVKSGLGSEDKLERKRLALENKLTNVRQAHPDVDGVILLATKVQKDGRSWQKPTTLVQLFKVGVKAGKAPKKVVRGKAKHKLPLQHLWNTLPSEKFGGQQYFYVADFLRELGLPSHSIKKRSENFNAMIAGRGSSDQLFQEKIKHELVGQSGLAAGQP
jgi:hypothetical protein